MTRPTERLTTLMCGIAIAGILLAMLTTLHVLSLPICGG